MDSVDGPQQPDVDPTSDGPDDDPPDILAESFELSLAGVTLRASTLMNSPMLGYVRLVVRLLEGVDLGTGELVRLLLRGPRQHSMAYRSGTGYVLDFLHQYPP